MTALPDWPPQTVTILATSGEHPHAIPVSAAVRAGPRTVLLALADGRGSLARVRHDPRVALAIIAPQVAVTAHGVARILVDAPVPGITVIEIEVDHLQDHMRPTFAIEAAISWRWTDAAADARDSEVRGALTRLAGERRELY
jgi:hypothetical protein